MPSTQYIGARYVPLFYTNPNDGSNAWLAGVAYDPLTIVTDLNQSYTSKIPVPATVGRPSENPTYWVMTGAYNAQVADCVERVGVLETTVGNHTTEIGQLDGRVDTIEDTLSLEANKRYIIVSDSYGQVRDNITPWTQLMQSMVGAANDDYYIVADGAMGFNRPGHSNMNAEALLRSVESTITDHNTITDIVIAMGANDTLALTGLDAAINSCISYLKSEYPNAKIAIGFIGNESAKNGGTWINYVTATKAYQNACGVNNVAYIRGGEYIMHDTENVQSDGVHPNANGASALARFISAWLAGDAYDYMKCKTVPITSSYFTDGSIRFQMNGGITSLTLSLGRCTSALQFASGDDIPVGTVDDLPAMMPGAFTARTIVYCYASETSDYAPYQVYIYDKKVYMNRLSVGTKTIGANSQTKPVFITQSTLTV